MICPQHKDLHGLGPTTTQLQAIALFIPECLEVKNGLCAGGHEAMISMIPFQSTNQHGLHVSETITKIHPKQKQKSGHFELGPIKITPLDPKVCGVTCIFPTHSTIFYTYCKYTLRIQSPSQMMIGVYNHLLRKVFRFHYHSQKVIGSLGIIYHPKLQA